MATRPLRRRPAIDYAAINALVPADLKTKLVFDKFELVDEHKHGNITFTFAAPKGWKEGMKGMGSLKAPDDQGFMTSMHVGSNCDGSCEPKDWAATADKVDFKQFTSNAEMKVQKDEKKPGSRLMVAQDKDGMSFVAYAWWTDGAKNYHVCRATLDKPIAAASEAFAKACQAIGIAGENLDRQQHGEGGASTSRRTDLNIAAVRAHDLAADREPETGAIGAGREEWLEDAR